MNSRQKPKTQIYFPILVLILAAIVWAGLSAKLSPVDTWYAIVLLLAAFFLVASQGVTGSWRGLLISHRNRMSLSRLQFVAWTLFGLSGILTIAMRNIAYGWETPLDFDIPPEIFVLMGISTASLIGSSAILGSREPRELARKDSTEASWTDLFLGEKDYNKNSLDLTRVQLLFFTFVLVLAYAARLRDMFQGSEGPYLTLPVITSGMNVLLGISHTGYLAKKNVKPREEASHA